VETNSEMAMVNLTNRIYNSGLVDLAANLYKNPETAKRFGIFL
jgi:hypothetical protein